MPAKPDIHIRHFQPENQFTVQNLINQGLGEHWGTADPAQNPDLFDIAQTYQDETFLVAYRHNKIVGTGALVQRTPNTAEIVRMSVAPACRRQGIGHRLLDALLENAQTRGFTEVILETTATWQGVIDFYLAYGFNITHHHNGDTYFRYPLTAQEKKP